MSNPESYRDVIRRLYGPELVLHPESDEEIRRGEALLGRSLPKVLLDYYRFNGHEDRLNRVHEKLLAPTKLERRDVAIIFYREHESLWYRGILEIDFAQDDPPVCSAFNETNFQSPLDWKFDHARLSDFLVTMAYWQAVRGGLPYALFGKGDDDHLGRVEESLPEIPLGENCWKVRAFSRDGQVCFHEVGGDTHIAGRTLEDRDALMDLIPIKWSLVEPEQDDE